MKAQDVINMINETITPQSGEYVVSHEVIDKFIQKKKELGASAMVILRDIKNQLKFKSHAQMLQMINHAKKVLHV